MEERIYKGYWWLPSSPDEQIAGTLTIDYRGNAKLDVYGCFGSVEDYIFSDQKEESVIFGRCYTPYSKMTDISLMSCHSAITLNFNDNTFPITRYTCHYVLLGIHCKTMEDGMFIKAHVNFKELTFWCPPKNIKTSISDDCISVNIETKVEEEDPLAMVCLDDGVTLRLKRSATYKTEYPKVYISQLTYLEIQKDGINGLQALAIIRKFERYLSVATLSQVEHGKITLYSQQKYQKLKDGNIIYHPIELVTYLYQDEINESFKQHFFLFYYDDISPEFGQMFEKLYKNKEIVQIWSNLVDSLEKKRVFTSNDFLVIIQALDGFSNRFRNGNDFLAGLKSLRDEFKDIKRLSLTNEDLEEARGSRNYYSHILKLEVKDKRNALEGWKLFDLTKKLRLLLICCVLNFMGLDNEKIDFLLNKCNNRLLG